MPGMKFFELYEYVKTIDPSLAKRTFVLDVSVTETHMREFLTKNKLSYMSRPFETKQLLNEVNWMLSEDK